MIPSKKLIEIKINYLPIFLIILLCIISSLRILQFPVSRQNHYILLAESFLKGKFDLSRPIPENTGGDIAFYNDKVFVFFGPLPAILLLPFVAFFKESISQHILGLILIPIDFYLIYLIAKKIVSNNEISLWLSLFFIFGTIFSFLALINFTSYQVQIISVSFVIFALYEYFYKRRWLLIGVFIALAGLTRPTTYLAIIFFIFQLFFLNISNKWPKFLFLITPVFLSIVIFGIYNNIRFNNFFETGYFHANLWEIVKTSADKGYFSVEHIPGNLYFLLLKGPEPIRSDSTGYLLRPPFLQANYWGMGIFFTSPLFLFVFLSKIKRGVTLSSWLTIGFMLIPVLTFYGIGILQYGYRYALDFYPFLFLILAYFFKENLPIIAKVLIVYSIFFNFYFMLSIWGIYPF